MPLMNIFNSMEFKKQLEELRVIAQSEMRDAIWEYVYMAYRPIQYEREYRLIDSVTASDIVQSNDSISFSVFLDSEKMDYVGFDGKPTYVPPLIEYGYAWYGYTSVDYFSVRPPSWFLEEAIRKIEEDFKIFAFNIVIKIINQKGYREGR